MTLFFILVVALAASAALAAREEGLKEFPTGRDVAGFDAEPGHAPPGERYTERPSPVPAQPNDLWRVALRTELWQASARQHSDTAYYDNNSGNANNSTSESGAREDGDVYYESGNAIGVTGDAWNSKANESRSGVSFFERGHATAVGIPHKYALYGLLGGLSLLVMLPLLVIRWTWRREDKSAALSESEIESEAGDSSALFAAWFNTTWLDNAVVNSVVPKEGSHAPIDLLEPKWTQASLTELLSSHEVPAWKGDALQHVVRELSQGKARICKSGPQLFRVIDMVVVLIVYEPKQLVLQVLYHPAHRRNFDQLNERTIKARRRASETLDEAVESCLEKSFGPTIGIFGKCEFIHAEESRESYEHMPGLTCLVRKHVARCSVIATSPTGLETVGLPDGRLQLEDEEYVYTWFNIHEMRNLKSYKHLLLPPSAPAQEVRCFTLQMLRNRPSLTDVAPCMPWFNSNVVELLEQHGFTFTSGSFGSKTMADLVLAMQEGRLELGVRRDTKELVGVVDVVSVLIRSRNDKFLAKCGSPLRLLYVQKLPNETVSVAASRLVRENLSLQLGICNHEDKLDTWEVPDSLFVEIGIARGSARNLVGRGYTTMWSIDVDVDVDEAEHAHIAQSSCDRA